MFNHITQTIKIYISEIMRLDITHRCLDYINNLTAREIWLLVIITAVLILFLVYRKLGVSATFVLIVMFFLVYIVYNSNIFYNWQKDKIEEERRLQIYNIELQKK